jgi:TolB protein
MVAMIERISLRGPSALTRRGAISTGAAAGIVAAASVRAAQSTVQDLVLREIRPIAIALPQFLAGSPVDAVPALAISQVIFADLKRSWPIAPMDRTAFVERIANFDAAPHYPSWRAIKALALVTGRVSRQPDDRLKAEFRLYDVGAGYQLIGQQYITIANNWAVWATLLPTQSTSN